MNTLQLEASRPSTLCSRTSSHGEHNYMAKILLLLQLLLLLLLHLQLFLLLLLLLLLLLKLLLLLLLPLLPLLLIEAKDPNKGRQPLQRVAKL